QHGVGAARLCSAGSRGETSLMLRRAQELLKAAALWPARSPRSALVAAGVLAIACVLGILRLRPGAMMESMFPRDDPAAHAMIRIMQRFSAAEELLVLASSPQPAPQSLEQFARRLERSVGNSPMV